MGGIFLQDCSLNKQVVIVRPGDIYIPRNLYLMETRTVKYKFLELGGTKIKADERNRKETCEIFISDSKTCRSFKNQTERKVEGKR